MNRHKTIEKKMAFVWAPDTIKNVWGIPGREFTLFERSHVMIREMDEVYQIYEEMQEAKDYAGICEQ